MEYHHRFGRLDRSHDDPSPSLHAFLPSNASAEQAARHRSVQLPIKVRHTFHAFRYVLTIITVS
jgi:hypothetical protein